MSECEKCQALLDLYIDHGLEKDELIFVEAHLQHCIDCQAVFRQQQKTAELLKVWAQQEIEPPEGFREALFTRLENEAAQVVPMTAARTKAKRPALYKLLPWAAAAVLLVALLPTTLGLVEQSTAKTNGGQAQSDLLTANTTVDSGTAESALETDEESVANHASAAEPAPMAAQSPVAAADSDSPQQHKETAEPNPGAESIAGQQLEEQMSAAQIQGSSDQVTREPMLASPFSLADAEEASNEAEEPPVMMYGRSVDQIGEAANTGETPVDWEALKQDADQLKQQYDQELTELQQQYAAEPTEALAQSIKEKEDQLEKINRQLEAIEQQDYDAYQTVQQPTE